MKNTNTLLAPALAALGWFVFTVTALVTVRSAHARSRQPLLRNRLNYWCTASSDLPFLKKLGMRLIAGQHNIQYRCLNPKTYFEKHPEWYGLRGGKRSPKISEDGFGDNYCTANRHACDEFFKNLGLAMLGLGRPFVIEVADPLRRNLDLDAITHLEEALQRLGQRPDHRGAEPGGERQHADRAARLRPNPYAHTWSG